ncbi:hypothetical protein IW262DRAFT_1373992 [Armillaria fumosa]|nr:hypothetical protein IW262DRAFT_1373992 [Armillaria fumosa]
MTHSEKFPTTCAPCSVPSFPPAPTFPASSLSSTSWRKRCVHRAASPPSCLNLLYIPGPPWGGASFSFSPTSNVPQVSPQLMSYDQSNPRRDDQYNSRGADDSYTSRNTDVQSQNHRASAEDNTTSYSNDFNSGIHEEARNNSGPSDAPSGYTGEDSSMNTGPIRYESYMPGPGDESGNDSTSHDITSSRNSDLYEDHDEGAGRGAEVQRYDAGSSNMGSHDDLATGDIGEPISNGYDSGSASWARENSVSDNSRSASRGYAGDSSNSSAADTSAVGTSRNDENDVGRGDLSIGMDSKDSGVRSVSDDTRDRNDVGGRDESARSATASTFEEATTGTKSTKGTDNTSSVGVNISSIDAPATSDALEADNSTYKRSDPTGAEPRSSHQGANEGTDDNYGRSPYDATNVGHDSQTTSSDGQTSLGQRGSSALDEDRQDQDAVTHKTSREDVDNIGAATFDDQPGPNEEQTSREGLQRDRDMTHDTSDQGRSSTTNYSKRPYDASNRDSSALHDDQQCRDAATAKTPKADLDNKGVSTFDDQTSPGPGIRPTRDDAGDRGSYDQLEEGADTPEAPSGYGADKTGSIEDSSVGIGTPVSDNNTGDGSGGRAEGSAHTRRDDNTSFTPNDPEQGEVTTSAPRADVDNDGPSSFDDQLSSGKYHSSDDDQRYHDAADTIGKGSGSRDDNYNRGDGGSCRGSSQGQDASSNIYAPTEDVDNSNLDKQKEDKQTGSDTASDPGQGVGSKREDTSTMSDRSTSGADQPPDTIGYSGEREDNKPYGDDGTNVRTGYDHSGYGGYAASTGYHAGGKPGLKDKLRGNAEVLVGKAAKKPELVERGLERKAGNVA